MKNLNYIPCVEINEYDKIATAKNNPTQSELRRLRSGVSLDYQNYLNQFPSMVTRPASLYNNVDSDVLRHSYKTSTIPLGDLIQRIIDVQTDEFQAICGYCLFYPRTSIDHYMPQEDHAEFSVLARNLLPSCQPCNTTKNRFWRQNNQRLFIHLYNDVIPNQRFLFGTLVYNNGLPVINYQINNNTGLIDPTFYGILTTHYDRLNLCELYQTGTSKVISNMNSLVKALRRTFSPTPVTTAQLETFILSYSSDLKVKYGVNYWQSIAMDILANTPEFIATL